jgi:translation initiation factor IF-1
MVNVVTDVFRSIEVEGEDGTVRINEGDRVAFVVEDTGDVKNGTVTKLSGKGEKAKIQIVPVNSSCEEVWSVLVINNLSVVEG